MNLKFALIFCLLFAPFVIAQDTSQITSEGVATIGTDPAAARDKAIEDALRRAVEQAVGTIVESETSVENYKLLSDRIYSRSSGYVKNYTVVSETREGNLMRVKVSADVRSGELGNDLAAIGVLQRRMKYPRVMVMIAEENVLNTNQFANLYSVSGSQAENNVLAKLKAKGFNVVDSGEQHRTVEAQDFRQAQSGDYAPAARAGKKLGAEIVIVGTATSTRSANNIAGSDLLSVSSTITANAVKAGTGQIIAQASGVGTAAHINEVAALQQSLQKASDKLADDLIDGILQAWKQESSGTRNVVVEFNEISPQELENVKGSMLKARGVVDVLVRDFSEGSANVSVESKTDGLELASSLAAMRFSGFRLVLLESTADRLEYRVVH